MYSAPLCWHDLIFYYIKDIILISAKRHIKICKEILAQE